MTLRFTAILVEAWARLRRDVEVLLPLAGLTMFLPHYAILLLVPDMPRLPEQATEATLSVWAQNVSVWAGDYGGWYLLAPALALLGGLVVAALYVGERGTLAQAVRRGAGLFLRYLLASILIVVPIGVVMLPVMAVPTLILFAMPVMLYVYGRLLTLGPVIVAERPIGAVRAILRSWQLTRGNGLVLAALYGAIAVSAQLLGALLQGLAQAVRQGGEANPVVEALLGALAALVAAGSALFLVLVAVGVYRRLASRGM